MPPRVPELRRRVRSSIPNIGGRIAQPGSVGDERLPLVPSSFRRACVLVALALLTATHAAAHAGSVAFWRITMTGTTARSEVLLSPDDVHRMAPGAATLETTGPVDLAGFDAALLAHFAIEGDGAAVAARIVAARVLP